MEKQKKQFSKLTILFYVLAILTFIYSIFSAYKSYEYVHALVQAGQLTLSQSIGDVIQYFADNSLSFIFYGFGFGVFGYLIDLLKCHNISSENVENEQEKPCEETKEENEETEPTSEIETGE